MLIESFLSLSNNSNSQVILTTHTPNLASMLPLESLIYISDYNDNKIQHGKDEVYAQIVSTLGILPDNIDKSKKAILLVEGDRKSTRLNSSHVSISYAVFCLKKKIKL